MIDSLGLRADQDDTEEFQILSCLQGLGLRRCGQMLSRIPSGITARSVCGWIDAICAAASPEAFYKAHEM